MGFGREIDHRVDALVGKQPRETGGVGDIPVLEAVTRRRLDLGQVLRVAGIGERIQVDDPVFRMAGNPVTDEIRPDKAGAAGYQQSAHVSCQCGMGVVSSD